MNSLLPSLPDPDSYRRLAELIHSLTGVTVDHSRAQMVTNRLRPLFNRLQFNSWEPFLNCLTDDPSPGVIEQFIDAVTTHETRFNRHPENFSILRKLLPVLQQQFPGQILRFFSAACSLGHEVWELSAHLLELREQLEFQFEVIGMDISVPAVETARCGEYPATEVSKLPPRFRRKYFHPAPGEAAVNPERYRAGGELRSCVSFRSGNLFAAPLPRSHVVFCRNVMIYFTPEDKLRLTGRLFKSIHPGGFLVPGETETLPANERFELLNGYPVIIYRRRAD